VTKETIVTYLFKFEGNIDEKLLFLETFKQDELVLDMALRDPSYTIRKIENGQKIVGYTKGMVPNENYQKYPPGLAHSMQDEPSYDKMVLGREPVYETMYREYKLYPVQAKARELIELRRKPTPSSDHNSSSFYSEDKDERTYEDESGDNEWTFEDERDFLRSYGKHITREEWEG